ncbi:MAG: TauD/TfdA family dioxygenase [Pseudomonadota bacterium]|nr:TauD/TfdA family dioxygenase [Pseudomonadota bacterium]
MIKITPLSPVCGAEITGVDLSGTLPANTLRSIENAWNKYLVIIFRSQSLSAEEQLTFASNFGPTGERGTPIERRREVDDYDGSVMLVTNQKDKEGNYIGTIPEGELWFHSDLSYQEIPHKATLLNALEIPDSGGNTMFANMYLAFEKIPAQLKEKLAGRRALHIYDFATTERYNLDRGLNGVQSCWQPIFIKHPDTGRTALYVSRLMTALIEGLDRSESNNILNELFDISEAPEIIYEHKWQKNDLLMTDNRCAVHARRDFPKEQLRLLRRCTVKGSNALTAAA